MLVKMTSEYLVQNVQIDIVVAYQTRVAYATIQK